MKTDIRWPIGGESIPISEKSGYVFGKKRILWGGYSTNELYRDIWCKKRYYKYSWYFSSIRELSKQIVI